MKVLANNKSKTMNWEYDKGFAISRKSFLVLQISNKEKLVETVGTCRL